MKKLNDLLHHGVSAFMRFHRATSFAKLKDQLQPSQWPASWKDFYYKAYARFQQISLPKPSSLKTTSFTSVLQKRMSLRVFSKSQVTKKTLSTLLYYAAGMTHRAKLVYPQRFYPSAGARYPLELYVISLNSHLKKGLYHYYVRDHSLELLTEFQEFDVKRYFNQPWCKDAAFFVILSAVHKRTSVKYGDRGYRHMLIEAGHLAQNIYLLASALKLNCCAVGGFSDTYLNELIELDTEKEFVIYALALGGRKS